MYVAFWRTLWSEWLKTRRSMASWLVIAGGALVPAILLAVRLRQRNSLPEMYQSEIFWEEIWNNAWESLVVMFLPLGAIVLTSLVTQVEHRYGAWKQVHATPQRDLAIFSAKLLVVLAMLAQAFVILLAGLWAVGFAPPFLYAELLLPFEPFPLGAFMRRSLDFFADALPIVGLQLLFSLRSRNVLVPVGFGIGIWTVAIAALSWRLNGLLLYSFPAIDFFNETGTAVGHGLPFPTPAVALVAFAITTIAAFTVFTLKRDRG